MSASELDTSKLPVLAKAAELEQHAGKLRSGGAAVATTAEKAEIEWRKVKIHFVSPDTDVLAAALRPSIPESDTVSENAAAVAAALEHYAETERSLGHTKSTLIKDITAFDAEVEGKPDWKKDEDLVNRQRALLERMNTLQADHEAAERLCANAITALYGGTHYREASADGSQAPAGQTDYGYSKDAYNAASREGQTPWGKPAEWDKPWYKKAADGIAEFGKGVVDSFKGTIEGMVAMVNVFDQDTFKKTWTGIGTLAMDLAVATSPVMALVAPGTYKNSADRLKNVGEAMIHLDEWKTNPAKAAGMMVGDIAQVAMTGGVGAGRAVGAAAIKASNVAGKAGQVAKTLAIKANMSSSVLGKIDVMTAGMKKAIHFAPGKFQNFTRWNRDVRYAVTDAVRARLPDDYFRMEQRAIDHVDDAYAAVHNAASRTKDFLLGPRLETRGHGITPQESAARTADMNMEHFKASLHGPDVDEMSQTMNRTVREHQNIHGNVSPEMMDAAARSDARQGTRPASVLEHGSGSHAGSGSGFGPEDLSPRPHGGGTHGPGSGSGGHDGPGGSEPESSRFDDDPTRTRLNNADPNKMLGMRKRSFWASKHKVSMDYNLEGLQDEWRQSWREGKPMTFTEAAERHYTRADQLKELVESVHTADDPLAALKDARVAPDARDRILSQLEKSKRANGGTLNPEDSKMIVENQLLDYQLDHRRELQLGGEDEKSNLQWITDKANRSSGAQISGRMRGKNPTFVRTLEEFVDDDGVYHPKVQGTPIEGIESGKRSQSGRAIPLT
jgi:hypothetical protein